jgi:hypothetical protein
MMVVLNELNMQILSCLPPYIPAVPCLSWTERLRPAGFDNRIVELERKDS